MSDSLCYVPDQVLEKYLSSDQLNRYFELLMNENRSINLVSRETSRPDFDRMVCECLIPLDNIVRKISSYLDIGSGSGLPAIPLLLARPEIKRVCLVERTQKKAVALKRMLKGLSLDARVYSAPFEEINLGGTFDLITLRYVKLSQRLMNRILKLLTPQGIFVYHATPEFPTTAITAEVFQFRISQQDAIKSFTLISK